MNPSAKENQNFEISEAGIKYYGEGFTNFVKWEDVVKVERSKNFSLLYNTKSSALYLPNEIVSVEEFQQIQRWFGQKAVKG